MSLAYCEGFVAEGYTDGDERWNLAQPYQLEAKDTWYSKHFHNRGPYLATPPARSLLVFVRTIVRRMEAEHISHEPPSSRYSLAVLLLVVVVVVLDQRLPS